MTRPEEGKRQKSDNSMALAVDAVTKIALRFPTADLAGLWWWWGGPRLAPEHAASCAPNLSFNNAGADGAAAAAAQPATSIVGQQRMMRLTQTAAPATPGSPQDICCLRASCGLTSKGDRDAEKVHTPAELIPKMRQIM